MSSNKPARSRKKKAGTPAPGRDKPLCVIESGCKLGQQQAVYKYLFPLSDPVRRADELSEKTILNTKGLFTKDCMPQVLDFCRLFSNKLDA